MRCCALLAAEECVDAPIPAVRAGHARCQSIADEQLIVLDVSADVHMVALKHKSCANCIAGLAAEGSRDADTPAVCAGHAAHAAAHGRRAAHRRAGREQPQPPTPMRPRLPCCIKLCGHVNMANPVYGMLYPGPV